MKTRNLNLALALLASLGSVSAISAAETTLLPEDRSAWTITGCSQCDVGSKNSDGGLQEMIDDNVNSFWHSAWNATGNGDDLGPGHYFIIDRGPDAPEISAFGYLPRQNANSGNGFVTKYSLYALTKAPKLPVCTDSWTIAANAHSAGETWKAKNTPLITGTFDIDYNNSETHGEHIAEFPEPTSARYLVFFIEDSSGSGGNKFANCAEFKTYGSVPSADMFDGKRVFLHNVGRNNYLSVGLDKDNQTICCAQPYGIGSVWTITKTESGKYKFHNDLYDYYLGPIPDLYVSISALTDETEAGEWNLNPRDANGHRWNIAEGSGYYDCVHTADNGEAVRWESENDSSWFDIIPVTEETYAEWIENYIPGIGYREPSEVYLQALAAVQAEPDNLNHHYTISGMTNDGEWMLPEAGKYYTISVSSKQYKGRHIIEPYGESTDVYAIDKEENIVPAMWQFASCSGVNSDLFSIFSANSGRALSHVAYNENVKMVAATDENVGQYDLCLEGKYRTGGGIGLCNYITDDRSDYAVITISAENGIMYSNKNIANSWKIVEISEIPVNFVEGFASFNFPFAVSKPEGVKVYTVAKIDSERAYLTQVEGDVIAANTPVILKSEETTVNFPIVYSETPATQAETASLLKGTITPATVENAYVFHGGIFSAVSGEVPANAIYLTADTEGDIEAVVMVTGIKLSKEEITLEEGETTEIAVIFEPEDATPADVTWTTSNKAVAAVIGDDMVMAGVAGKAVLTATCGSFTAKCNVTVVEPTVAVETVTLNKTELTLEVAATETLTATIAPEGATNKTVIWTSSDENVATVSAEGTVTAVAPGTATITAACGNVKAECTVTVSEPAPVVAETISLNETTLSLEVEETATLTATITPAEAADLEIVWTSSDEAVATVSAEGVVTAVAAGTATITATCGDVKAECTVTVSEKIEDLIDEIRANAAAYELYDLAGRRIVATPARGIYLLNRAGRTVKISL